jgi:sialate O-acetylesterase
MKFSFLPILLCPLFSIAQLKLAEVFSDNMILQRDRPIKVWGKSIPGNSVTVLFSKEKKITVVNSDSVWIVSLRKQKENPHPQILSVSSGVEQIELKNILIGDVWICTGQSNMEWPMIKEQHWNDEIRNSNQPNIRLLNPTPAGRNVFGVPYTDSLISRLTTEKFYDWKGWQQCDSSSVKLMSAVAYYFANKIYTETGVPIGIINLSIGGAPLETFISTETLSRHATFSKKVNGNWLFNDALPVWVRERGRQNLANSNIIGDELGPNHAYKPGFAFKAGVDKLRAFSVKGILVYQGESNAEEPERVDEYKELFKLFMKDYRGVWSNKQLPIYWVQLSSMERKYWPLFRNNQLQLLKETRNTGMAVTSDIGLKNDVHPPDKKTVGERLARWPLYSLYNKNITASGPLALKAKYNNREVIITFNYTAKGLMTSDGKSVKGFSIDGDKENEPLISNSSLTISVKTKPEYVYYGWQPFSNGNLVNSENLPASTFKIKVQ